MKANCSRKLSCETKRGVFFKSGECCVKFLKKIFDKILHQTIRNTTHIPGLWDDDFKRIRILDSTAFQVPKSYMNIYPGSDGCSQPSGVKIQLEYELKSGDFLDVEKRESFYISRLKLNIAVYIESNEIQYYKNGTPKKSSFFTRIHIPDIVKQMSEGERDEIKDVYVGREKKLKTRLILYKLTKEHLKKGRSSVRIMLKERNRKE